MCAGQLELKLRSDLDPLSCRHGTFQVFGSRYRLRTPDLS